MSSGETLAHRELKRLALAWALEHGFSLAGCEVRVPKSGYRADVVAATPRLWSTEGRVALFECKQARADFLRDQADEPALRAEAYQLSERLLSLRAILAVHRPDLRRGESLFAEYDEYNFQDLRHDGFHEAENALALIQRKLVGAVKFARLRRYAAADHLYLVTESEVLAEHEIPVGWGWLVRVDQAIELRRAPTRMEITLEQRLGWLEQIARAGTRDCLKAHGVKRVWAEGEK
jgi:hypothetical protein